MMLRNERAMKRSDWGVSIGWERDKERSVGNEEKEPICCFIGVADMSESKCIL